MAGRRDWTPIIEEAAQHARRLGGNATLRQIHYLLVSNPDNEYRNTGPDYNQLSSRTAQARREGWFPRLIDRTRTISWRGGVDSVAEALMDAATEYRRNYQTGQTNEVWVIVEKATLLGQVQQWLEPYGNAYVALRGYGSQTIADNINGEVGAPGTETATMLYIGDHDPSGQDIQRDIISRTGDIWDEVIRLAVNPDQITELGLHPAPGKKTDSRAGRFLAEHGELVQVEVEAVDPAVLRQLVVDAIEERTDIGVLGQVKEEEAAEKAQIMEFIGSFEEAS